MTQVETQQRKTQILDPDFSLKEAIGKKVDLNKVLDTQKVNQAKETVNQKRAHLIEELQKDIEAMENAYQELVKIPDNKEALDKLTNHALTIKSHSGMLGFPLATAVAKSLFVYATELKGLNKINKTSMIILLAHVQTIQVIYRDNITNDGGQVGKELLAELARATVIE